MAKTIKKKRTLPTATAEKTSEASSSSESQPAVAPTGIFTPARIFAAILALEVFINVYIIRNVPYTEIDWKTYMQQVRCFLSGTLDYTQIRGDTGPLVYPAGFVYIYSLLYGLTDYGTNVTRAQYIFLVLYLLTLHLVYRMYAKTKKVPILAILASFAISRRVHSIFVLRLFNDPVATLLLYLALNLFMENKWTLGSVAYSAAVSVKMNVLLFSPALLMAYFAILRADQALRQLFVCASVQVILGFPFLLANPLGYIKKSFEINRVFSHEWTVNYRFLPEDVFASPLFHAALFMLQTFLWTSFSESWWVSLKSYAALNAADKNIQPQLKKRDMRLDSSVMSQLLITPLLVCNFIGVVCSRTLHYQFYVWYYHSLPHLLWSTKYPDVVRYTILGLIELCWNIFPSTNWSSLTLQGCHLAILYGLYASMRINKDRVARTKRQ